MFRYNVLGDRLILTIDDIHVQFAFAALNDGTQLRRTLDTALEGFKEHTVKEKMSVMQLSKRKNLLDKLTLCAIHKWLRCYQIPFALYLLSSLLALEYHCWGS